MQQEVLKGVLIFTAYYGWQVRYEFGQGQSKNLFLHKYSTEGVKEFGMEGEEVEFIIRGTEAKRSINGFISSALIINNPKYNTQLKKIDSDGL
jgi:hypothetical protein